MSTNQSASGVAASGHDDETTHFSNKPWSPITLPSYPFTGLISVDFAEHIAGEMSVVHNTLIRSLNAIWHHAPLVSGSDVRPYVRYAIAALETIHEHHDTEEELVFPVLEKAGLREMVKENVAQHKAFHDAMEVFEAYLKGVAANREQFDAQRTRELLKAFADPLVEHLHDEIKTIQPETMYKVDKHTLKVMYNKLNARIQSHATLFISVPLTITSHNSEEAPLWPPIPGPLKWMAQNLFVRVHSDLWKFAPYDASGQPQ